MAVAGKIGDWTFKAFSAGLGLATIYLTATFSVNVYRGLSWHKAQTKAEKEGIFQNAEEDGVLQNAEDGVLQNAGEGSTNQNAKQS